MLRVLAIDPSMTCAGFCLPDGSTTVLASKAAGPDVHGMAEHRHRLGRQRLVLDRLLDLHERTGADLVAIEGYAYNQQTAALSAGELGGIIRNELTQRSITWVVVPPNLRGKYATGKGNASKDMVLQAVAARLGRVFATSDECDAWVIWQMAKAAYGLPLDWSVPQAHTDALTGVDWPVVTLHTPPFVGLQAEPTVVYKPPTKTKKKR